MSVLGLFGGYQAVCGQHSTAYKSGQLQLLADITFLQQHMEENHGFLFTSQQVEQHLIYGLDPVIMEMAKNLQVSAITTHEMLVAHFQAEDGSTLIHNAFLQAAVILFSNICKARAAAGIHDRNVIPWDKLLQYNWHVVEG